MDTDPGRVFDSDYKADAWEQENVAQPRILDDLKDFIKEIGEQTEEWEKK